MPPTIRNLFNFDLLEQEPQMTAPAANRSIDDVPARVLSDALQALEAAYGDKHPSVRELRAILAVDMRICAGAWPANLDRG